MLELALTDCNALTLTKKSKSFRTLQASVRNQRLIDLIAHSILKINQNQETPDLPIFVEKLLQYVFYL